MVAESDMEYRQEVLDIIDAYTIEQEERKTKLKQSLPTESRMPTC